MVEGCLWVSDTLFGGADYSPDEDTEYDVIIGPLNFTYDQARISPRFDSDLSEAR